MFILDLILVGPLNLNHLLLSHYCINHNILFELLKYYKLDSSALMYYSSVPLNDVIKRVSLGIPLREEVTTYTLVKHILH